MNPTNTILLQPSDVLFFRDGRPMEGSLAGHGAAWPLPSVTDAALHAALHRSGLSGHKHDQIRNGERALKDARQFGSLVTAGPFPVHEGNGAATWYFPRPLDLLDDQLVPALAPRTGSWRNESSLAKPLEYAVVNRLPPSKDARAKAWLSSGAFRRYLHGGETALSDGEAHDDSAFSDAEATVGIAIDPATGTTGQGEAAGKIYSARYLRLRDGWQLGVFAKTEEKNGGESRLDLISNLITEHQQILVGGQQRLCSATALKGVPIPLPLGKCDGFKNATGRFLVKWILLSPAIWPEVDEGTAQRRASTTARREHPGGWLPSWVDPEHGDVLLRSVTHEQRRARRSLNNSGKGYASDDGGAQAIAARLVAAIVPKPIVVTGWALPNDADRPEGGAKSTHLAVAAGAVYYFEAGSPEDAAKLAAALNWHGAESNPTNIKNRRSTLMGEKGFGLGVCGTWSFHPGLTTAGQ